MSRDEKPVRDRDTILVRLPDGLKERIAELGRANGRSMGAEAAALLEKAIGNPTSTDLHLLWKEADEVRRNIVHAQRGIEASEMRLNMIRRQIHRMAGPDIGDTDPIQYAQDLILTEGRKRIAERESREAENSLFPKLDDSKA